MTAAEISRRLLDIGRSYELGEGFNAYREEIGITTCRYCSADNKVWYLNDKPMSSGNYGDNLATCWDNETGICTYWDDKIEQKCLKTEEEFLHIEFDDDSWCESKITYALFILDTEPILS